MKQISRRAFLQTTSTAVVAAAMLRKPASYLADTTAKFILSERLSGWEYRRGGLGGPWEAWRKANDDANIWTKVEVPHCFNAVDAVDPDGPYYQGPGWYRTRMEVKNPYPAGHTLLHFEGAGQKTEVFIHTDKVGSHVGGYDEFTIDITDQVNQRPKINGQAAIPIAVMCDNSRDLEMIPSNLSDFNLYGGLYRYVNLIYVPAVSIERVHIGTELQPDGKARVAVRGRLYNPTRLTDDVEISIRVFDPNERVIHESNRTLKPSAETQNLSTFTIDKPELWSPQKPSLYRCEVSLKGLLQIVTERFGLRTFEFIKNGPFKLNGERLLIRGTQRHEDHAGVAAAMTSEMMRKEMRLIKDLGANFIRLGHF